MSDASAQARRECAPLEDQFREVLWRSHFRTVVEPDLRDAACDFVQCLHQAGATPESMVITVKAIAREYARAAQLSADRSEQIMADLVGICIEEYFQPRRRH